MKLFTCLQEYLNLHYCLQKWHQKWNKDETSHKYMQKAICKAVCTVPSDKQPLITAPQLHIYYGLQNSRPNMESQLHKTQIHYAQA
jgi:hypothetical protein